MTLITKAQAVTALGAGGVVNPTPQEVADVKYFNDKIETGRVGGAIATDRIGGRLKGLPTQNPFYQRAATNNAVKFGDVGEVGIFRDLSFEAVFALDNTNGYFNIYIANNADWDRSIYVDVSKAEIQFGFEDNVADEGDGVYVYPTFEYPDSFEFSVDDLIKINVQYQADLGKMVCQVHKQHLGTWVLVLEAEYHNPQVDYEHPVDYWYVTELIYAGAAGTIANSYWNMNGSLKPTSLEDAGTAYPDVDEVIAKYICPLGELTPAQGGITYGGTAVMP